MANHVARWDPFADVVTLQEAMDRLMEDGYSTRQQPDNRNRRFANMPGIKPEDVEIILEGDTLTLRAERPAPLQNVNYVIQERTYGTFQRTLNINIPVDAEKAEAKFDNGLLTLTVPKAEAARPKQIKVMSKSEQK
jgi:HSP20 family protein